MSKNRIGGLLLIVLVVGCSSAPPAPEGIQDRKNRAADYLKFGRQAFQETQYEQALSFYQIALDLNTAVDNEPGMAVAWNSVATALTALGKPEDAGAALTEAEALAAASGDRVIVLQVAVNQVQADLAKGDTASASRRLEALKPFPQTAEGAALEHASGTLEKALDHPTEALAAFDRALVLNGKLNLKQEAASNRYMKASVYSHLGKWDEALVELEAALALDKTMENTLGIGLDWRALGTVSLKRGKDQEAWENYRRAFRLFRSANLVEQQKKTLEMMLPVAESLGLKDEKTRYQTLLEALSTHAP